MVNWLRVWVLTTTVASLSLFCSGIIRASDDPISASGVKDVYPKEFFEQFSPVSAADMLDRVPGISFIIEDGFTENRGFGTNQDRVLINGRRMSGKESDGRETLERIAADQVERIEVFRAGSMEADNRTTDTQVNIVLKADDGGTSATWEFSYERNQGHVWRPGGKLTYAAGWKILDYSLAFEGEPATQVRRQIEDEFTSGLILTGREIGEEFNQQTNLSVSGDGSVEIAERSMLRINGIFTNRNRQEDTDGVFFLPLMSDGFVFDRRDFEDDQISENEWEIGGDFEHEFASGALFKLLGLHNVASNSRKKLSGNVLPAGSIVSEILSSTFRDTETILRGSFKWPVAKSHNLEMGVEGARNSLDSDLQIFRDMGGSFFEINLPLSRSFVKELRTEAFVVYTWQTTQRLNLETDLFFELSKISQTGLSIDRSRTLTFLKPAVEARYAFSERDQLQVSAGRSVGQLNFNDFVATINDAVDDVDSGNPEIVPDKTWAFEAVWDHQLKDDRSSVRTRLYYNLVRDVVGKTSLPGGTTDFNGNIGNGRRYGFDIEMALVSDRFGWPGAILEAGYGHQWSSVIDPFTGADIPFRLERRHNVTLDFRHDVAPLNLFYGVSFSKDGPTDIGEIDEVRSFKFGGKLGAFIEYRLPWSWVVRVEGSDLLDSGFRRTREFFAGPRSDGALQTLLLRDRRLGREFIFSVRGRL